MTPDPSARVVIVKLGGSVITRKRDVERIRPKVLARLAREVASVRDVKVVLLHGAGSFGHPGAHRFGLARPPGDGAAGAERARGAAIVAAEVRRLHLAVLRELVSAGASPASVPMATHARNRAGELVHLDPSPVASALEGGFLPVSFGDVVPDDAWGSSILSADTIAVALAPALGVERVVFVSDVEGILEGPPGRRRSTVREVTPETVASLRPPSGAPDVTGGIRGKATAMLAIAAAGADAGLISGLSDGAVARAIHGATEYGSWARAKSS
ncbi:MAG TPA: isopentenyl phosphate kinase [Thermoplasmata archaeon]|jgi:isopentenyl phosphate kinase|nr:isopentenyl phosphate kinase [Thermoplasmata archaeon]